VAALAVRLAEWRKKAALGGDLTLSLVLPTIVVEWSQTGQRRGLLAANAAELGHADDERQYSALGDTRDAQHQIKPLGNIIVGTQTLGYVTCLRSAPHLEPGNVVINKAPQPRVIDMLEPGLEARDVLLKVIEKGQISGQFRKSWIWRDPRRIEAAAQVAINTASSASFLARRECTRPNALTWIGCSTNTVKPAVRKCSTTPRS
jgi:hypothetical protein